MAAGLDDHAMCPNGLLCFLLRIHSVIEIELDALSHILFDKRVYATRLCLSK
jgi:hypothetical protein